MSTPVEKLERQIATLRTTNAGLTNEIESLGGQVDVATARVEFLMNWLEEQGVISKMQRLEEQMQWEKGFKPQLVRVRDGLREAHQQAQREYAARMKKAGKAQIPEGGPKLIIP
jgi:phage shock protein A